MSSIGTILLYCSNEYRFLRSCIEQARCFSSQIIIPICDHLFNGIPEDPYHLNFLFREFPDCVFVVYPFLPQLSSKKPYKIMGDNLWHCVSRFLGVHFSDSALSSFLFLDVDEIVDGKQFSQWLQSSPLLDYEALRFSAYWYFRESSFQARTWENTALWVQKRALCPDIILQKGERGATYEKVTGKKRDRVGGLLEAPLFHHYSWVRSKEEMVQKVHSWGHRRDRNWDKLIEEEFSHEFQGRDFVHGYDFITVKPFVEVPPTSSIPVSTSIESHSLPNVYTLSPKELQALLRRALPSDFWQRFFR